MFKQKTAYDVRISDWSSDVCSSDLRKWTIAAISSGRPIRPRGERIFITLSSASPLTATASGVRTPPGQTALTRMPRGLNSSAARSEEHKSELQLLMRISYAVCCLKKQKRHIKTNAQHTITYHTIDSISL